jgi:hypothetical protein
MWRETPSGGIIAGIGRNRNNVSPSYHRPAWQPGDWAFRIGSINLLGEKWIIANGNVYCEPADGVVNVDSISRSRSACCVDWTGQGRLLRCVRGLPQCCRFSGVSKSDFRS